MRVPAAHSPNDITAAARPAAHFPSRSPSPHKPTPPPNPTTALPSPAVQHCCAVSEPKGVRHG